MILTTEAFNREQPGGIPLEQVKELKESEIMSCIPSRIKVDKIYDELQAALDHDQGLENDELEEFDPLADLAREGVEGMTSFHSPFALSDDQYVLIL